ncbi:MAG: hypothetical protein AAGF53_17405 [Pseudomonadota bacterium]
MLEMTYRKGMWIWFLWAERGQMFDLSGNYSARLVTIVTSALLSSTSVAKSEDNPINYRSADEGGPRRFEVVEQNASLFATPSYDAETVADVSKTTLLSNLGCTSVRGKFWCRVYSSMVRVEGFVQVSSVQPAKGPDGTVPTGIDDSKQRARKRAFDETGEIACAQNRGEKLGKCRISVARSGGGDATAIVTFSNSFTRELYFTLGDFVRANATMSGVGKDIDWMLRGETYVLRVDDQRFEIPASYILGNK